MKLLYPWKVWGRYEDDYETIADGFSEQECVEALANLEGHGELVNYGGLCDDDYVDGEYIGRENIVF